MFCGFDSKLRHGITELIILDAVVALDAGGRGQIVQTFQNPRNAVHIQRHVWNDLQDSGAAITARDLVGNA